MANETLCQECRFWDYQGEGETALGMCRRYAPRPEPEDTIGGAAVLWPSTQASDWCGDFSRPEAQGENNGK